MNRRVRPAGTVYRLTRTDGGRTNRAARRDRCADRTARSADRPNRRTDGPATDAGGGARQTDELIGGRLTLMLL